MKTNDNDHRKIFATRLRDAMFDRDLKQIDIARYSGVEQTAISRFLRAENSPSISNLIKVSEYLGVSIDYLLGVSDNKVNAEERKAAVKTPMQTILDNEAVANGKRHRNAWKRASETPATIVMRYVKDGSIRRGARSSSVLGYLADGSQCEAYYRETTEGKGWFCEATKREADVTYWMPLPTPPGGNEYF